MPESIESNPAFKALDEYLDQSTAGQLMQGEAPTDMSGVLDAAPETLEYSEETAQPTGLEIIARIGTIAASRTNYETKDSVGFKQKYDDGSEIIISLLTMPKQTEDGLLRGIVRNIDLSGAEHNGISAYSVFSDGRVIKSSLVTAKDMSNHQSERRWLEPAEVSELYASLVEYM
ncbi:MAG: hypothetical protein ACMG55_05395 [Microcoleus sp.]